MIARRLLPASPSSLLDRQDLTRDGRKKIGAILIKFGAEVDKSIAEGPRTKKDVRDYARAVEKAASDLANRKTRAGILERVTKQIW